MGTIKVGEDVKVEYTVKFYVKSQNRLFNKNLKYKNTKSFSYENEVIFLNEPYGLLSGEYRSRNGSRLQYPVLPSMGQKWYQHL